MPCKSWSSTYDIVTTISKTMLTLKRFLKGVEARLSRTRWWLQSQLVSGSCRCNACERAVAGFYRYGARPFGCPYCRSSTRERFVKYLLDHGKLEIPSNCAGILHVAPSERSLIRRFSELRSYMPVDLFPDLYPLSETKKLDLMTMREHGQFDLVYLSHVMEHVPDDLRVLRNLFESLRPGGQALFLVPLWNKPTLDGTESMTGRERERLFGQWDHARQYGPDFADRIQSVGFEVQVFRSEDIKDSERIKYGLQPHDWVFCGKRFE